MTVLPAREAYRRWAPNYERENVVTTLECGLVENLSPSPRGLRLLDVGCGTGRRLVGTGAAEAVGIDSCPEMLAVGNDAHRFGSEVVLIEGEARSMPLPDTSFDVIWCRLMIGHIADCSGLYGELGRVAKPRAHVIVTDFHPAAHAAGLRRSFRDGNAVLEVEHHVHSVDTQTRAARRAGLTRIADREAAIGPKVRHFYEAAERLTEYEQQRGMPMVLALGFVRDD